MPDSGAPRPINLNLPSNYLSKPMTKVSDWLEANTPTLRVLTEDQIVQKVRTVLGPSISVLNNGDLAAQVRAWAKSHGIALPSNQGAAAQGDPEVIERLKKIFGSIPTEVKWVGNQGTLGLDISGLTSTLTNGKMQYSINVGFDRAIQFKTTTSGMEFGASIGPQSWNMTFTFGTVSPNLPDLESVFKKGASAVSGVLSNLDQVNFRDPSKTKQVFSPYLDPIKDAIDAAKKTSSQKPGSVSFGAWVQGPVPGAAAPGVPGPPASGSSPGSQPASGISAGLGLTILF